MPWLYGVLRQDVAWVPLKHMLFHSSGVTLILAALLAPVAQGEFMLAVALFLLGLGWTLQKKGHVRVDVLQSRWSPRRRNRQELNSILLLLLPFAFGVMAISIAPALRSWSIAEMSPDPGGLPRTWVKSLIPLGFLLLGLQGIAEALRLRLSLSNSEATQAAVEQHQEGGPTL